MLGLEGREPIGQLRVEVEGVQVSSHRAYRSIDHSIVCGNGCRVGRQSNRRVRGGGCRSIVTPRTPPAAPRSGLSLSEGCPRAATLAAVALTDVYFKF